MLVTSVFDFRNEALIFLFAAAKLPLFLLFDLT